MGIGTSKGAFYEDEFHYAQSQWDPKYDNNVVTPDQMGRNQELDKTETDPNVGIGLEVSYKPSTPQIDVSRLTQPKETGGPPIPMPEVIAKTKSGIEFTNEDIDQAINVGMSSGPGTMVSIGKGGTDYFRTMLQAEKLKREGSSAEDIFKQTGMFERGNRWLREISDDQMKIVDKDWQYGETGKLPDFIEHPTLYEEFPHMKDIEFKVADKDYPYIGGYNAAEKRLTINPRAIKSGDEGILDVVAHELQHVVQTKEGRPQGSNPTRALDDIGYRLRDKMIQASEAGDKEHLDELLNLYVDISKNAQKFGEYMYQRVPGEVEANQNMARRKLTPEERRSFSPDEMQRILNGETNSISGGKYYPEFDLSAMR